VNFGEYSTRENLRKKCGGGDVEDFAFLLGVLEKPACLMVVFLWFRGGKTRGEDGQDAVIIKERKVQPSFSSIFLREGWGVGLFGCAPTIG
jgi:hypothetical protein